MLERFFASVVEMVTGEKCGSLYPQIDKNELVKRNLNERKKYIYESLYDVYHKMLKDEIDKKINNYNLYFLKHKEQIEDALSEAFDINTRTVFNDLTGNITINPVGPRFLKEKSELSSLGEFINIFLCITP